MKTKILTLALLSIVSITSVFAQDRTTVTANNSEISDNLDLRAVASIFGDSKDLADFERRLNNPEVPISNLDLNGDNQVDYLRVIETVEGNAHLITCNYHRSCFVHRVQAKSRVFVVAFLLVVEVLFYY
jgi:putative cell wall-binding protein